jgi:class 3 adenylate cyclase/tetratricopeptide (TPR) repeat protein
MMSADVDSWLGTIGLPQYADLFRSNEIDFDILLRLTSGDLLEIGVTALGHRKKLLAAIAALGDGRRNLVDATSHSANSEAERRHLTVMFVDLVGSTAMSSQLDPEEMRELIGEYQNAVAGEVLRFEGHVAQFLGDGVLAYFGWPQAHEDDAERAVRSGLAVAAGAKRLKGPDAKSLQTRIGIATGVVVVGDLIAEGVSRRHAVVGETPNLAARVQAIAEPGAVVIANSTRHLVGEVFVLQELKPQTFKGISGPVPVYSVVGERDTDSRFSARQIGGLTPVVGRDQELALMVERWRLAKASEGQVVLLSGEAGIGKSRIAEAVIEAVGRDPNFLIRYQCSPYHTDSALFPVIQQLTHALRLVESDTADQRMDRLEALLAQATDDWREAAPLVAALLGIECSSRYGPITLSPQHRRSRTLACLIDQLTGLASRKPVLWVVEDAHWIDPTTLELIELALDRVQGCKALALITSRPTSNASFGSHPAVTRLTLNKLGRAATNAIMERMALGKALPEALRDEIVAKTDGIPLFVEETTKAVIESGVLREDDYAYHLDGPLSAIAIPGTLHDSLMARLDRLQPVKEVAPIAAVIGRRFDHRTLAAIADLPEGGLERAMGQLADAELIFRRGMPPDATYLFKHALVRDAAYESLLRARRVSLHARLVDVLEAQVDSAPELKAYHAEAANLKARAIGYWDQAGAFALARPAYKEAIADFENAIRLCRTIEGDLQSKRREQSLHLKLGQALIANRGHQAAATRLAFENAMNLADEIGDASLRIQAMYGQWSGHFAAGTSSGEIGERFAALSDTLQDTGPRVVGLRMLASERFHKGRFSDSLALAERSLAAYDSQLHGDLRMRFGQDPLSVAMMLKGWNLWFLGFPDQAELAIQGSVARAREMDHANSKGYALSWGATVFNLLLGRVDRVESAAREAVEFCERMSLGMWQMIALMYLGWSMSQRDASRGLEEIEKSLRTQRKIGVGRFAAFHLALAADCFSRAGHHDLARIKIKDAFDDLGNGRDVALAAEIYRIRANLLLRAAAANRDAAADDLRRSLEIAIGQQSPMLQLRAACDLVGLQHDASERRRATDGLASIYAGFSEGFSTPDLVKAKAMMESHGGADRTG